VVVKHIKCETPSVPDNKVSKVSAKKKDLEKHIKGETPSMPGNKLSKVSALYKYTHHVEPLYTGRLRMSG